MNEAEVDWLCGRNWAEDPIQGNSDLWVITCNVLRRRAVSGCVSDSISPTQSSAIHSLCLNCPICFPCDAQLFLQPFPLHLFHQERETHTCELVHTHKVLLCCSQTSTLHPTTTTQFLFSPLSDTQRYTNPFATELSHSRLYILFINILYLSLSADLS